MGTKSSTAARLIGATALGLPGVAYGMGLSDHGWEVALVHTHAMAAATATLNLVKQPAQAQGLKAVIERDGKRDYEVSITGFRTKKQAAADIKQAKVGFPSASLERT
jgi:hypothetical protein